VVGVIVDEPREIVERARTSGRFAPHP
jgi:hypothetical protein